MTPLPMGQGKDREVPPGVHCKLPFSDKKTEF